MSQNTKIITIIPNVVQLAEPNALQTRAVFVSVGDSQNDIGSITLYSSIKELTDDNVSGETLSEMTGYFSQNNVPAGAYLLELGQVVSTSGQLICGASGVLANFTAVTDGEFSIALNGQAPVNITGLNFSSAIDLDDVASIISSATAGALVEYQQANNNHVITSDLQGASSAVGFLTPVSGGSGTDITGANFLSATQATGATEVAGTAPNLDQKVLDLVTFINNPENRGTYYIYHLPKILKGASNLSQFDQYGSDDALVYFSILEEELPNSSTFLPQVAGKKQWIVSLENTQEPNRGIGGIANYIFTSNRVSSTTPARPMVKRFVNGQAFNSIADSNSTIVNTAKLNWIGDTNEGGLSNLVYENAFTQGSRDMAFWYSADYVQINLSQELNAFILQRTNDINPIKYNQSGIDELSAKSTSILSRYLDFNILEQFAVNFINFADYKAQNPNDIPAGVYNGVSFDVTILTFFTSIRIPLTIR